MGRVGNATDHSAVNIGVLPKRTVFWWIARSTPPTRRQARARRRRARRQRRRRGVGGLELTLKLGLVRAVHELAIGIVRGDSHANAFNAPEWSTWKNGHQERMALASSFSHARSIREQSQAQVTILARDSISLRHRRRRSPQTCTRITTWMNP